MVNRLGLVISRIGVAMLLSSSFATRPQKAESKPALVQFGITLHQHVPTIGGHFSTEFLAQPSYNGIGSKLLQHNNTVSQQAKRGCLPVPGLRVFCGRGNQNSVPWSKKAFVQPILMNDTATILPLMSPKSLPSLLLDSSQNPRSTHLLKLLRHNETLQPKPFAQVVANAEGLVEPLQKSSQTKQPEYGEVLARLSTMRPTMDTEMVADPDKLVGITTIAPAMPVPLIRSERQPHQTGKSVSWNERNNIEIVVLIVLLSACLLCLVCIFFQRGWPGPLPLDTDTNWQICSWVESLPVLACEELEHKLPVRSGYDCLLNQPQISTIAVRIEGRAVALPGTALLNAPLAQRPCLLFSSSATEVRLDGVPAPPVAYHAASSQFQLELVAKSDGQLQRIQVRGQDVALFGMVSGKRREEFALNSAPKHLQDFVRSRRASWSFPGRSGMLEFSECFLDAGAMVTCVGKLGRTETGDLQLFPLDSADIAAAATSTGGFSFSSNQQCTNLINTDANSDSSLEQPNQYKAAVTGLGLTSWECAEFGDVEVGKLLISDNPSLLGPDALKLLRHDSGHHGCMIS